MNRMFPVVLLALACGAQSFRITEISPEDVLSAPPSTLILDVRSPEEFASGHVPNAVNIPHDELASRLTELQDFRSAPVVVYCERGGRAGKAALVLTNSGFSHIRHLTGDMSGWREQNLPVDVSSSVGSENIPSVAPLKSS